MFIVRLRSNPRNSNSIFISSIVYFKRTCKYMSPVLSHGFYCLAWQWTVLFGDCRYQGYILSSYFLSWHFSLTASLCSHRNVVEAAWLWPFILYYWLPEAFSSAVLTVNGSPSQRHVNTSTAKTEENSKDNIFLLTWSPAGRYCWGPNCLAAGPTPGLSVRLQCPEQGRE